MQGIGPLLRQMRKQAGLSQGDLEKLTGIKRSNISRLEGPNNQNYKTETLGKVAQACGYTLEIKFIQCSR